MWVWEVFHFFSPNHELIVLRSCHLYWVREGPFGMSELSDRNWETANVAELLG